MNAKIIEILKDFRALKPLEQVNQLQYYAECINSIYQAKSKEEARNNDVFFDDFWFGKFNERHPDEVREILNEGGEDLKDSGLDKPFGKEGEG